MKNLPASSNIALNEWQVDVSSRRYFIYSSGTEVQAAEPLRRPVPARSVSRRAPSWPP